MFRRVSTLPEFYHQLSIVLKAKITLPEGLAEIAIALTGPLAGTCKELAADAQSGLDLASAMRKHPKQFPAAHIAALAASPDTLPALAQLSTEGEQFLAEIRKGMSYPIAMILLSTGLLAGLMLTVIPIFAESAMEIGDARSSVYAASSWTAFWWAILGLSMLTLLVLVWLMIPGGSRDAIAARLLRILPGMRAIQRAHDYTMLCALWAALLRAGRGDEELLLGLDDLLSDRHLRSQITVWHEALALGKPLFETIIADDSLELGLRRALESDERSRSKALASAAERFRSQTQDRGKRVAATWTLVTTQAMIAAVAIVIIGLFRPFTQLIGFL
jgi:protein transport protein HofC